jgi:hypothetical protein
VVAPRRRALHLAIPGMVAHTAECGTCVACGRGIVAVAVVIYQSGRHAGSVLMSGVVARALAGVTGPTSLLL